MKVRELKELLEYMDEDASVNIYSSLTKPLTGNHLGVSLNQISMHAWWTGNTVILYPSEALYEEKVIKEFA